MAVVTPELDHSPLVVVCGADDNYARPLAVTLYSALVNLEKGCTLYLYIIDGGITEQSKQRLQRVLNVEHIDLHLKWISPSNLTSLSHIKTPDWVSAATYLRLLIPDILPEHFQKAIYLDGDLLVEGNLKNLWNQEMGEYALLASTDFGIPYVSSNLGILNYKELGLAPHTPYFNAGVLVLNLPRWREEKISEKVIRYLSEHEEYVRMGDQEGLNAILANDWGKLHPTWNVISHILFYENWEDSAFKEEIRHSKQEIIDNADIFHFAGGSKPWQIECEHPAQLQWIRYLQASKWFQPTESMVWFSKWFLQYYPRQFKVLMRKFMFILGLGKSWELLRVYVREKSLMKMESGD
ncbi:glycosyltransferase family 8 protein [Anabaena subtropica]|uniref:Glycosyltransferase family 8 protein n=1 Tax=Anabaena subtropica FACHB-260 TaxID=2692884 RepID=A0ABR8CIJ9_9NOST|nr:glycosyltransferase family 8 protein [Anabaena subtropica]MBD2342596.1 glycosyltransferase family 8 protein [Anabaena subtropica FACHB-260]